jgi:hypothetical protein
MRVLHFLGGATMVDWLRNLLKNPARDWVILFLFVQGFILIDGATNTYSRWTTMVSIVEDKTVRIDRYYGHTIDWAKTPDGHYYSNKAPGPMLLGLPLFWALDHGITENMPERNYRDIARLKARNEVMQRLSFTTQALPFAALVLAFVRALQKRGASLAALHFTAASLLFGNTAVMFMNTYFGHAMSAVFVLGTLYALLGKRYGWAGLCIGLASLCDYGATLLLLPATVILLWDAGARAKRLAWFTAGGFFPGVAWVLYHTYCFGGPFSLPNKFQNPMFVDVPKHVPQLWGILRLFPEAKILRELLFGSARGLLYTQGWLLIAFLGILALFFVGVVERRFAVRDHWLRDSALFSFTGLALLLFMNCAFNGWHGGATPGPRYLSIVLPAGAIAAGLAFSHFPSVVRQAMVVFLTLAVLLFIMVYGTRNIIAPENALFTAYLRNCLHADGTTLERLLHLTLAFGWVGYRAFSSVLRPESRVTNS